ncbi:hypothetical protein C5C56_11225 [Rathayibacter sp. AY1D1]|uniref:HNH endonuclease signature motif containing protein n=1 Tax=Rathayibacter sp. AY1D1 TaxID=2080542 RepID=UPI000CE7F824|nr:hypothetical protein C5C56_11225 [Rathayibacter sp. AY1D1]
MAWVIVLGHAWVPGVGRDGIARAELDWRLRAVLSPDPSAWDLAQAALENALSDAEDAPNRASTKLGSYSTMVDFVESRERRHPQIRISRNDHQRSAVARAAVLLRAAGRCENPRCTGMPFEQNRRGEPILDVDHISDLALGGADHPLNMIALCPNCHAVKTRGERLSQLRTQLVKVARAAHGRMLSPVIEAQPE